MNAAGNHSNSSGYGHNDSLFYQPHLISPGLGDNISSISPDLRMSSDLNSIRDELQNHGSTSLFDNGLTSHSGKAPPPFSMSPRIAPNMNEIGRLKDELANKNAQISHYEEMWKSDMEDNKRKVN